MKLNYKQRLFLYFAIIFVVFTAGVVVFFGKYFETQTPLNSSTFPSKNIIKKKHFFLQNQQNTLSLWHQKKGLLAQLV